MKKQENYNYLIILCIIVVFFWIANFFILYGKSNDEKIAYGEMFGVINSLFAGLAFAGVFYTIHLQKKELKETKEEFQIQTIALNKQRFENTFFQMLTLHHEIVKNLKYTNEFEKIAEGRAVFKFFLEEINQALDKYFFDYTPTGDFDKVMITVKDKDISIEEMYDSIQIEYSKLFSERFQNSFGHYFRNLYHIFKFIYLSTLIKDKEKKFYASITRAQLSEDELESAVYNGIAEEYGNPKFTFLINEYDLFQNMNWNSKFLDPRFQIIYGNLKNKINNPFKDN